MAREFPQYLEKGFPHLAEKENPHHSEIGIPHLVEREFPHLPEIGIPHQLPVSRPFVPAHLTAYRRPMAHATADTPPEAEVFNRNLDTMSM